MGSRVQIPSGSAVYEPLAHMRPSIRISPFTPINFNAMLCSLTSSVSIKGSRPDRWLDQGREIKFYESGRQAILSVLKQERLKRGDEVLIITTTQGPYISGCVTQTIEKVCRWGRKLGPRTRMALVIHEFGFPCQAAEIPACQKRGIPILEDCAYGLGSRLHGAAVGNFGDYAVYSLTKHYPVPFGGFLVSKSRMRRNDVVKELRVPDQAFIKRILGQDLQRQAPGDQKRRENWTFFNRRLKAYGLNPFFALGPHVIPGAFVFQLPRKWNGAVRKKQLVAAGVEATEYYGMGGFYFPVHQFLTDYEREYILRHFLNHA